MFAAPRTGHPNQPDQAVGVSCARHARGVFTSVLLLILAAACVFLMLSPAVALAQTASLSGRVSGPDGRPVVGATVAVSAMGLTAETGADGRYELRRIPYGAWVIEVRLLGYQTLQLPFEFAAETSLRHDFQLKVDPLRGDSLEARARARLSMPPHIRGFYDRRSRGYGHFFTREEIDRMQARQFTDVLRRVPGTRVEPVAGPFGTSYVVRMGRATGIAGARDCSVLYYVNGAPFLVALDIGINTYVRPDDIAAIEVYSGASSIPSQFTSTPNNSRCGVVVIWTYAGRTWPDGEP